MTGNLNRAETETGATWRSIHVHHHDTRRQDDLLLDAVRPVMAQVRDRVTSAFFVRHWLRGPHVRLNVRATPEVFTAVVRPVAEGMVGEYLRTAPSRTGGPTPRTLAGHRRLAELEAEPGPLLPWHPDNSVREQPYDPRLSVLGSEEATRLLTDLYDAANDLVFRTLAGVREAGMSRLGVAYDLLIATAHAFAPSGIGSGFVSFRSHAEAFLTTWPEGHGKRSAWDEHYTRHADALTRRVDTVISAAAPGTDTARDWVTVLGRSARRGRELINSGHDFGMRPRPGGPVPAAHGELLGRSPFHRALEDSPRWPRIRESAEFLHYRLSLNLLYLHLTRLGVTPMERFMLCHLTANAVEDAVGVRAIDLLRS
ncbi:thiopeptide maturation pyridine synthase [Actinomadura sp. NPDC048021]|uniref:thiopeptide maturation pyridine synthase n=1 Tax=Actinomadura sp. NPDC048021 TaxID=3155385 RepID=UPI0033D8EF47